MGYYLSETVLARSYRLGDSTRVSNYDGIKHDLVMSLTYGLFYRRDPFPCLHHLTRPHLLHSELITPGLWSTRYAQTIKCLHHNWTKTEIIRRINPSSGYWYNQIDNRVDIQTVNDGKTDPQTDRPTDREIYINRQMHTCPFTSNKRVSGER